MLLLTQMRNPYCDRPRRERTSRRSTYVLLILALCAGLALNCNGRDEDRAKKNDKGSSKISEETPITGKADLLKVLNEPSVLVRNGQAAIIRFPAGYAFVIPRKTSLYRGGFKVICSESGDFRKDGVVVAEGFGEIGNNLIINVRGHEVSFDCGSNVSTYVSLDAFDEKTSIALYNGTDASKVDLSQLRFTGNQELDDEMMLRFLREEGILKGRKGQIPQ